ncbi:serine/threonine-protein kinase [Amycolatopsis samaneae]|uniref:non-specific serine/threonine protein kinase n=1 Tax=Amycolatopsis samaneae TaxID=664691 RepID=A0ABW5GIF3_9PSEU
MFVEARRIGDRYRLLEPIGGGAMGTVWRAKDETLGRTVAIKELVLPDDHDEKRTDEAKQRAMREARIAARLTHPHAIAVFAVLEEEDRPWLIMEHLTSTSLAQKLEEGPLTVDEVVHLGAQVSSALAAAHRVGIVHRDVKPGNILVGSDGTAKISDFGISRAVGDVKLTATGDILGTPAFLSPEVARGEDASSASDVFSFGATLYAAVEGNPPYGESDNQIALLYRASSGDIVPPTKAERLTPLLVRMLATDPAERPSMSDVERELKSLVAVPAATLPAAAPASAEPAVGSAPAAAPAPSRNRRGLIFVGLGALLLCAAVITVILLTRHDQTQQNAASPSNTPSTSAVSSPSETSPPPSTTPSSTPPSTPSSSSTPPPAETPAKAVESYYGLLPGNLDAAYARLTPKFKAARSPSFAGYSQWWNGWKAVAVSNVTESGSSVSLQVTYTYQSGNTTRENLTLNLVQQNGTWMIDSQS